MEEEILEESFDKDLNHRSTQTIEELVIGQCFRNLTLLQYNFKDRLKAVGSMTHHAYVK